MKTKANRKPSRQKRIRSYRNRQRLKRLRRRNVIRTKRLQEENQEKDTEKKVDAYFRQRFRECPIEAYHIWFNQLRRGDRVTFYHRRSGIARVLRYYEDFHPQGLDSDFACDRASIYWDLFTSQHTVVYD
jgi:hypothetical protein